jgi:hypothetical protein
MTRNLVTAFGPTSERGRVDDVREFVDRMSEAERIGRFGVWR